MAVLVENIQLHFDSLVRQFTVQTTHDSTLLSFSVNNIQRMLRQFNHQFNTLFRNSDVAVKRALSTKFKAILASGNRDNLKCETEYRRLKTDVFSAEERLENKKRVAPKRLYFGHKTITDLITSDVSTPTESENEEENSCESNFRS